jgi:Ser/Thr protein kinase RdoA (MazF antagonist)
MNAAAFAALTQEEQIQRIEILGREALRQFGVEPVGLESLVHAENTTFRIEAAEGTFCLRICRAGYQSDANVQSELAFLAALSGAGFDVPQPYEARIVKASAPEVPEPRNCVLLRWQDGEFAREGFTPEQARGTGRIMAEMHEFAAKWFPPAGFTRQELHAKIREPFLLEEPVAFASESDRQLLVNVLRSSRRMLERLGRDPTYFGLIHGDLHRGNVLFDGAKVRVIDFDDLGWGYWVADLAAALAYEVGKAGFDEVRAAMLMGYQEVRPLPPQTDELLNDFLKMRFLTVAEWILQRMDNPQIRATGARWIERMAEGIRTVG